MMRRATAFITLMCFMLVFSRPVVAAGGAEDRAQNRNSATAVTHAVTSAQLHQAVQLSYDRAAAARGFVAGFLARPDVRTQLRRVGLAPDSLASRAASLSDQEILRLQRQIMAADLQNSPAGLSTGAIVAIVIAGIAGTLVLIWILVEAEEDLYYDYYY